jgi:hypothetical protein
MSSRAQRTHPLLLLRPAASPAISPTVGARHLAVDRPSQAPSCQIDPTIVIPYPRPCLATTPTSQNWDPGGEPRWTSPAVGLRPVRPPPSVVSLPPLARGPVPMAPSPRRSPAGGPSGPPAHAVARARARLGRIPPGPAR